MTVKHPSSKYITRPYEQMDYPVQHIQIDVKLVFSARLKKVK